MGKVFPQASGNVRSIHKTIVIDLWCGGRSNVDLAPFDPGRVARRTPTPPGPNVTGESG